MHSVNLVSVDCNFPIGYTYHRGDNLVQSWPDHILTYPYTIRCLSVMSLLFPVLTIFLIICLSLFLLISHFPLIVPLSLLPMTVLCRIPRLHLFPGSRLLQAITINTVSVLLVTCPRYQMSFLLVVLLIVFLISRCWISYALVFWPP